MTQGDLFTKTPWNSFLRLFEFILGLLESLWSMIVNAVCHVEREFEELLNMNH